MNILLAGNPNSGKTTLFNRLTKSHQKVANYAGVSVEIAQGKYFLDQTVTITDLPGAYSLKAVSSDEDIALRALKDGKANGVIAVIDGTHLKRSLYFMAELSTLKIPITFAVNFYDKNNAVYLKNACQNLSKIFGAPFVPISAKTGYGVQDLMQTVLSNRAIPNIVSYEKLSILPFLNGKIPTTKAEVITEKLDSVFLGKYTALPLLLLSLFLTVYLSSSVGGWLGSLIASFLEKIKLSLQVFTLEIGIGKIVASLLIDGVVSPVFSVLSFLPQVVLTFAVLSFFEFTGYASRIAFLTDGFLRGAGLSGKATFSVLTSCGCAVNGVTATRIIEDFSERSRAILLSPLMPCGAKLLVMQWIAQNFFARPTLIVLTAYLFTGLVCYGAGALLKKFGVYGQNLCDFVMELPTYRTPTLKAVLFTLWQKIKSFLVKAGTVIVATSIIIWFLSSFNFSLQYGKNNSMLKVFGKGFSVILKPLGFLSEEIGISLLCGVFARESIISALSVDASGFYSAFSIFGFMLFVNLYPPCVCALGAMKKEFSSNKNFFIAVLIQFLLAYSTAVLVNFIGILFVFNKVLATFLLCFAMLLSLTVILLNNSKIFQKRKAKLNGFNFF